MQYYANKLFSQRFLKVLKTGWSNTQFVVKYTVCKSMKIHAFAKCAFIYTLKIVSVLNELHLLTRTSLTSARGI